MNAPKNCYDCEYLGKISVGYYAREYWCTKSNRQLSDEDYTNTGCVWCPLREENKGNGTYNLNTFNKLAWIHVLSYTISNTKPTVNLYFTDVTGSIIRDYDGVFRVEDTSVYVGSDGMISFEAVNLTTGILNTISISYTGSDYLIPSNTIPIYVEA